ncbi:MAG: ethanolamine ammonia-lyase reactivating factor EutA [Synergistaceae bacterium]|jgi:ethanolamine utilization protein EutA|nr:ethanolamine ammonia-lyase reactivating factor EutA [Synergistaceae bacterium]
MNSKTITSVGIDIGTSTLQVVFSHLVLENTAGYFSIPHITFVDKKILYSGQIRFTPLKTQTMLDDDAIRRIVHSEYERASLRPEDIDTGAIIITGEAARKENAALLLNSLSGFAGEFVVSTAGPDLEAVIAGKGSGAQHISQTKGICVMNLDIGGGTTNIAVFDSGETVARGCLDIGGRLIRIEDGRIAYLSKSAAKIASSCGLSLKPGDVADMDILRLVCRSMTDILEQMAGVSPVTPLLHEVKTLGSAAFVMPNAVQAICFSGGVADCIARSDEDPLRYGDIGPLLGEAIGQSRLCSSFNILRAEETIRATVVGAGSYATTVSGSTISHHDDILPIKNLPALKLNQAEQERCYEGDSAYLAEKIRWFLGQNDTDRMILAIRGERSPSYARLEVFADCICEAVSAAMTPGAPILMSLESDTAKALGQLLEFKFGPDRTVVCIDEVHVEDGDYVDLGRPLMDGMVIPVVIKTLALG